MPKDTPVSTDGRKDTGNLPPCLYPSCSEKHYVKDCSNISSEEAKKLLAAYRGKKKAQTPNAKVSALSYSIKKVATTPNSNGEIDIVDSSDVEDISETIVNFLGDHGVF